MAGFTLVHGSTQNSSGWGLLAAELRRDHKVETPELPKTEPTWSLGRYAEFIAQRISTARPRIVVAHSFSGVFLPLLASHCDALVFLAAVVPEPGRSLRDQFARDPTMLSDSWISAGQRWFDPGEHETLAREFLFHDCDEQTVQWGLRTVELFETQNLAGEACALDGWPVTRRYSIVCSADRTISPLWGASQAREVLGIEPYELASGHCPHVSRAKELSGILSSVAREL
jgi:hypothetical protein